MTPLPPLAELIAKVRSDGEGQHGPSMTDVEALIARLTVLTAATDKMVDEWDRHVIGSDRWGIRDALGRPLPRQIVRALLRPAKKGQS